VLVEHRVVPGRIESAPGLVRDPDPRQPTTAFEHDVAQALGAERAETAFELRALIVGEGATEAALEQ
jgi:hypothetical protein